VAIVTCCSTRVLLPESLIIGVVASSAVQHRHPSCLESGACIIERTRGRLPAEVVVAFYPFIQAVASSLGVRFTASGHQFSVCNSNYLLKPRMLSVQQAAKAAREEGPGAARRRSK